MTAPRENFSVPFDGQETIAAVAVRYEWMQVLFLFCNLVFVCDLFPSLPEIFLNENSSVFKSIPMLT